MLPRLSIFGCFKQIANMQFCIINDYCLKLKTKALVFQVFGLTSDSFMASLAKYLKHISYNKHKIDKETRLKDVIFCNHLITTRIVISEILKLKCNKSA